MPWPYFVFLSCAWPCAKNFISAAFVIRTEQCHDSAYVIDTPQINAKNISG